MRILMTTTGYAGHVLPMVPFARALIRAGHELRIVGPRSRGQSLARFGLPYEGIYDSPEGAIRTIGILSLNLPFEKANGRLVAAGFGNLEARAALPHVLEAIDSWRPEVIVRESYEFAAVIAAELREVPLCCVSLGLDETERWILAQVSTRLSELREEHGLHNSITPTRYLTLMPEGLEDSALSATAQRQRFRDTTSPAHQPLDQEWTRPSDPLVYISFGTLAGDIGLFPKFYRAAAGALSNLPVRVLITVGDGHDPADLEPLPENVRAERWIPQDSVMAHAAVTVSHGGYGSMMSSLRHGVPMVVMPLFTDDHHRNAACIEACGAGLILPSLPNLRVLLAAGADAIVAGLAEAVGHVLEEDCFKSASVRIARQFEELPPIDQVSTTLLRLREQRGGAPL